MGDPGGHAVEDREFEPEHISARNSRYGRVLFLIYLTAYATFVLLNTFWPAAMDAVPAAGVNLAIWMGMGLIVGALVLAVVYCWLCQDSFSVSWRRSSTR